MAAKPGRRRPGSRRGHPVFSAVDSGDDQGAYAMMSDVDKSSSPYVDFVTNNKAFRAKSGALIKRTLLKVTWTKDPANAPFPGIYAAVDIAATFGNIDRDCGYVVFYQASEAANFQLMRWEKNFIDNTTAADAVRTQSQASLDAMWTQLSANCPNYPAPAG